MSAQLAKPFLQKLPERDQTGMDAAALDSKIKRPRQRLTKSATDS